jgi:hypothetical protein
MFCSASSFWFAKLFVGCSRSTAVLDYPSSRNAVQWEEERSGNEASMTEVCF